MNWRMETSALALAEIEETVRWIAVEQGQPMTAARWLRRLESACASLVTMPRRCRRAKESAALPQHEVRQLLVGSHRVLFALVEDRIIIVSVRRVQRQPMDPDQILDTLT